MARDERVTVSKTIHAGMEGQNAEPLSAVFRPFRVLLDRGRPPGAITYAYLAPLWEALGYQVHLNHAHKLGETNDPSLMPRILGAFTHTRGDRLLYFPGFGGQGIHRRVGGRDELHSGFSLDHLTLEADVRTWHATSLTGDHLGTFNTDHRPGSVIRWFSFTFQGPEILEPAFRDNKRDVHVPAGDVFRRRKEARTAASQAAERIVMAGDSRVDPDAPYFWHFELFLDPNRDSSAWPSDMVQLPPTDVCAANQPDRGYNFLNYKFTFPGLNPWVVLAGTRISGKLSVPVWFQERTS